MSVLQPKTLGLDEQSHETIELRRFLGPEPWSVPQLTEALASSNCLGLTDPAPSSPANLLAGLMADLAYPNTTHSKPNMLTHLDDLILQTRLRYRMVRPQNLENMLCDVDFLLSLVQELGGKLLQERKSHSEALVQAKEGFKPPWQKRQISNVGTGGGSNASTPISSQVSIVGVDDQISAIRRTQEERRARLSSAIAQLKGEVEGVKAREQQLSEENELLIRSTAQQEQVLHEYRTEGAALSDQVQDLIAAHLDVRSQNKPDKNSPGALAVSKALARATRLKCNSKAKIGLALHGTPLTRMRCAMQEIWDAEADTCTA